MSATPTLTERALEVLCCADGREKAALSRAHAADWQAARARGEMPEVGTVSPPDHPARPDRPELLSPRDVPRPLTLRILVVSSASAADNGGRMPGSRRASIVLPEPGGPIISKL